MSNLSERIDTFIEKQEKVYLKPNEAPPKGSITLRGRRGGRYYFVTSKTKPKPIETVAGRPYKILPELIKNKDSEVFDKIENIIKIRPVGTHRMTDSWDRIETEPETGIYYLIHRFDGSEGLQKKYPFVQSPSYHQHPHKFFVFGGQKYRCSSLMP